MEVSALPLAWLDRENRCIRLQDAKGIRAREVGDRIGLRVPGKAALEVLDSVTRPEGNTRAFPAARGNGHVVGPPRCWSGCVIVRAGRRYPSVLRHSFAAAAAGMGFSELTIAGLLGHKVLGVTARYAHMPDSVLVGVADRVAEEIQRQMVGNA
jgi:integrase